MMARRSYRGKPKKKPKAPKPKGGNMLARMQKMQDDMAAAQDALADETVTVTAGGGVISVVVTGHQRIQSIAIEPEVVDPEDVEMLQDMLVAAVNAAIEQSQTMAAEKMEGITGGLGDLGGGLDGLLGGLGGS
jgi:DNA-binding YbaB/EbfC family protein